MLIFVAKVLFKFLLATLIQMFCLIFRGHMAFAQVVINEVHPAPSSGNDWVELKNTSSDAAPLAGWALEDSTGAMPTTPSITTLTLPPNGYTVIEVSNRLNN